MYDESFRSHAQRERGETLSTVCATRGLLMENREDEEIAAIEWIGVTINAWNRIATPSRYQVKP